MPNEIEHRERMKRFAKAQKILDLPHDEFDAALAKLATASDRDLIEDYSKYLDSLVDNSKDSEMGYLDYYRFKAELNGDKDDDVIEYLTYGQPSFDTYDFDSFDLEGRVDALCLTNEFRESRNRYFAVEGFVYLVSAKIAPPAWMLEALAQGLSRHLRDPDPRKLARQMGLQGKASGKTNPYEDYRRVIERRAAILEMLFLVKEFEVSRTDAAKAVIIKRKLSVKAKTLCNDLRKFVKSHPGISHADISLGASDRQRFVERFPPRARKLLAKKLPR